MNRFTKYLSVALKLAVAACSLVGIYLSILGPEHETPHWNSLLYFTIQSNFWIAVVCIAGAVMLLRRPAAGASMPASSSPEQPAPSQETQARPAPSLQQGPGHAWSVVKLMFTIAITLTGTVYCFILAPTSEGDPFRLSSCLVHVYAPLLAVVDYLLVSRWLDLRFKDSWWGTVPPLYYLAFASLGYVLNWQFAPGVNYPYFFMNWGSELGAFGLSGSFPFMGVAWYIVALLAALVLVGLIYISAAKLIRRCSGNSR